jgi:hypothetical protein
VLGLRLQVAGARNGLKAGTRIIAYKGEEENGGEQRREAIMRL